MDDLQHLLDQLDQKPEKSSSWVDGVIEQSELECNIGEDESIGGDISNDDILAFPTTVENVEAISQTAPTLISQVELTDTPPKPSVDLHKYLSRLDGVTDEILNACRSDRQEAQDVINMLRGEIDKSLNKSQAPSRMFVDGLVKAVEVKANINMTAVKMMEANSKMLAAMKATMNVQVTNQNVNVTASDGDLERVLDEPMTADDDY